jgi:DNA-binding transcriptional ArsR family regulator
MAPVDEATEASVRSHRALGDPTRLEMCWLLAERERTVTDLAEALSISQPLASHHLRVLRQAGIVAGRRESYWTRYRLLPQRLELLKEEAEMLLVSLSTQQRPGGGRQRTRGGS